MLDHNVLWATCPAKGISPSRREARRLFLASIIYLPLLMALLMADAR